MSFPNTPPEGINPIEGLDSNQVALLLLVSIAFEELGLAHLINTEAEKLQGAIGTLVNKNEQLVNPDIKAKSLAELLAANREVEKVLRTIIKKEMLLEFKFENILEFLSTTTTTSTTTTSTSTTTTSTPTFNIHYNYFYFNNNYFYIHYNYYKYNIYNFYYNMRLFNRLGLLLLDTQHKLVLVLL